MPLPATRKSLVGGLLGFHGGWHVLMRPRGFGFGRSGSCPECSCRGPSCTPGACRWLTHGLLIRTFFSAVFGEHKSDGAQVPEPAGCPADLVLLTCAPACYAPVTRLFPPRAFPPGLCMCCSLHLARCSLCIRPARSFHALSFCLGREFLRERGHSEREREDGQRAREVYAIPKHSGVVLPGTHGL